MGDNLLFQAIMIGVVYIIAYMNVYVGSPMIDRPIIVGTLTGLVLGDLKTGITVGAAMELAFLGAVPIGASNPPDMISGTIIGTAFVILSGQEVGMAVALGIPVASLMSIVTNLNMMFVYTEVAHMCDRAAEEGNAHKIEVLFNVAHFATAFILALIVGAGFYFGLPVIEKLLEYVPEFILTGMDVVAGMLPAIGCAMLARMLLRKELSPYLLIGFLLVVYLGMPTFGVALVGLCVAALVFFNSGKKEVAADVDDNEF